MKRIIIAGLCVILPAVIITDVFAWLYKEYGQLPKMQPFIYCIKPAIIAIIVGAVYPLARKSVKSFFLGIIGIAVLALSLAAINEIYLMFGAGLSAFALRSKQKNGYSTKFFLHLPFFKSGRQHCGQLPIPSCFGYS